MERLVFRILLWEVDGCGTSACELCYYGNIGGLENTVLGVYPQARSRLTRLLGGCFRAKMTFPQNYPLYPPKMKFETPIFHPNGKPPIPPTIYPN